MESGHSATATGSHDMSIQAPETTIAPYTFEAAKAAVLALFRQAVEAKAKGESGAGRRAYKEDIEIDDDDDDEWTTYADNIYTTVKADKAQVAKEFRESRKYQVQEWLPQYLCSYNSMEQRYCVWNDDGCCWTKKSSGIIWVGVHGADSVCVVTRRENLDNMCLRGNLSVSSKGLLRSLFRKSIICELEDLEDPSSELRQKFEKCIKKPFGVVSANPGPGTINIEASDYDEDMAIDFLEEKMKRDINFDVYETTKTAIHAFQHLFRKKLKADEIEVSVMDPDCVYVVTEAVRDSNVEELSVGQIEMYLDDTIGESSEMGNLKRAIGPVHKFLKKQRTNRETYLLSPGGSSDI